MEYLDVLRRGGWLPDPADRVRLVVEHGGDCQVRRGGRCRCVPRLVLCTEPARTRHLSRARRSVLSAVG